MPVHEAVTPSADEAERITTECERRGISTENLTFRIGSSADVLRTWEPRPLDFVLSTAVTPSRTRRSTGGTSQPHVKIGGLMLLDDAYMPPVAAVVDHLRSSQAWQLEAPAASAPPSPASSPTRFPTASGRASASAAG